MKLFLFCLVLLGLTQADIDKQSTLEALRSLESKLQMSIRSKLDQQGVKQLNNLLELTAFSHLTQLATKTPQQLAVYMKQLEEFKRPDLNLDVYKEEMEKVEKEIKRQDKIEAEKEKQLLKEGCK